MKKIDTFNELFKVPPAMRRYIELVMEPREVDLILAMNGETLGVPEIAERMNWSVEETGGFLIRAYERHVVTKIIADKAVGYVFDYVDSRGKDVRYAPARFYDRLDPLTMQENWTDIPEEVRKEISDWWLDGYVEKVGPIIDKIKKDPNAYFQIKQKDFLLLEEALEQVEAAEFHVVLNCDCRSSEMACKHMREGCIRFDDGARYTIERGLGRVVTKEECKQIVIETDRDGLMHIGAKSRLEHGLFGFCNCCTCCCFPLRTSVKLGSAKIYPRTHYQAHRDIELCTQCGVCAKRCPFQAFFHDGERVTIKGKSRKRVAFDADKCYGCGLCANACPVDAIRMKTFK
jgi:ferredoxin